MKSKAVSGYIYDLAFWIFGCSIYAVSFNMIIEPNSITPGGFTGVAAIINILTSIPTGTVLILLNIPLLYFQYRKFGGVFIIKTAAATFILSVSIDFFSEIIPKYTLDPMLAAVFGGILCGFGLSLVLLRGATTGGVDVVAKLINQRYNHISVGRIILIFDVFVVVLTAVIYRNVQSALYSVIAIYASSAVIDKVLYGADKGKLVLIITEKSKEISNAITEQLYRGVTVIPVFGGYTGKNKSLLLCAVRIQEAALLHKIVNEADGEAFIIVTDVGEIFGEGFKIKNL